MKGRHERAYTEIVSDSRAVNAFPKIEKQELLNESAASIS